MRVLPASASVMAQEILGAISAHVNAEPGK
jgi:hypothetical protein